MKINNSHRFIAVLCLAAPLAMFLTSDGTAAEQLVLNPATISGTVNYGFLVTNVTARAETPDGNWSSGAFASANYSLTVEDGLSYAVEVTGTLLSDDNATRTITVDDSRAQAVNGVHSHDVTHTDIAAVTGNITVIGGTIRSYNIYSSASTVDESYRARVSEYISPPYGDTATYSLNAIADESTQVYGSARFVTDGGLSISRSLSTAILDLEDGGAAVDGTQNWTIDLTQLDEVGTLSGAVTHGNTPSGASVNYHRVYATRSGISRSTMLPTGDGSYSIADVPVGNYSVRALSYFATPTRTLSHRLSGTETVNQGANTTGVDFLGDFAEINKTVLVDGFYDQFQLDDFYVQASGANGSYSRAAIQASTVAMPVLSGTWTPNYYSARASDGANVTTRFSGSFYGNDYSHEAVTVQGGDSVDDSGVDYVTVETSIYFDVEEPTGPDVNLAYPYVYGSEVVQNGAEPIAERKYFYSNGPYVPAPQPQLRIVARPGTYQVTARVQHEDGSTISWAPFEMVIEPGISAPMGDNVVVVSDHAEITFDSVITEGVISVTASPIGPTPPHGFQLFGPVGDSIYYDITPSDDLEFAGLATVCIDYDDTNLDGGQEFQLTLNHWEADGCGDTPGPGDWCNITELGYPDAEANRICGRTSSFSPFALFLPSDTDGDGILDLEDNCPDVANPEQEDFDEDGEGDLCGDADDDGVVDSEDNCLTDANSDQVDYDSDGAGDVCDVCPYDGDDDADSDGVCGDVDLCPATVIPEAGVPVFDFWAYRYALADGDRVFDTHIPTGYPVCEPITLDDTAGCSCEQIAAIQELDAIHTDHGCGKSVMEAWIESVSDTP